MVELAQPEIIQIYRKRSGINQGDFGSRAFNVSYESGRTKMKNIELGRQIPSSADLNKIAALLDIPVAELMPGTKSDKSAGQVPAGKVFLSTRVLSRFPGLDAYVGMLNSAARVDDRELLVYLCHRIAALLKDGPKLSKQVAR